LNCDGNDWQLSNKRNTASQDCIDILKLYNASYDSSNNVFIIPSNIAKAQRIHRMPAGLPVSVKVVELHHPIALNKSIPWLDGLASLTKLRVDKAVICCGSDSIWNWPLNLQLEDLRLMPIDEASFHRIHPLPSNMLSLRELAVPLDVVNITQLKQQYPVLRPFEQYLSSKVIASLLGRRLDGNLFPSRRVQLDSLDAINIVLTSAADLVQLWRLTGPEVVIPQLAIQLLEQVPSHIDSSYFPATGHVTRLEFLNPGLRHFDLDTLYAALNMSAFVTTGGESSYGVVMGSGPALTCTPRPNQRNFDAAVDCSCIDPPFVNAPHCPRVVPWQCPDGTEKLLLPTDICDGKNDCDDGSDESGCRLTVVLADTIRLPICLQKGFTALLVAGVGVGTQNIQTCYSRNVLIRSNRSAEGHAGGETYRIFVADDGCGYALFRLKHDNGSGWYTVSRAEATSILGTSVHPTRCFLWTVRQFQEAYQAFHGAPFVTSTTVPSRQSRAPSPILSVGIPIFVVVLLVVVTLALRRRSTIHSDLALEQLLIKARSELDELYGGSNKTQKKSIITLSK
jgi:hypothetical protein